MIYIYNQKNNGVFYMFKKIGIILLFIIFLVSCNKNEKEEKIIMQYDSKNLGLNSFIIEEDKKNIDINNPLYNNIYYGLSSHEIEIKYYSDPNYENLYNEDDYINNRKIYVDYNIKINDEEVAIDDMINAFKYYENEKINIKYYLGEFNNVKIGKLDHEIYDMFSANSEMIGNINFTYFDSSFVIQCFYNNQFYSLTDIYNMDLLSYNDVVFINSIFRLNMLRYILNN